LMVKVFFRCEVVPLFGDNYPFRPAEVIVADHPSEKVFIHQVMSSRTVPPPSAPPTCSSPIRWRQALWSSSAAIRFASPLVRARVGVLLILV